MMENTKNIKVAIYPRVSTEEQAKEGYSIKAQIEKLTNYALAKDWTIHDIYEDAGKSGKDIIGRPAMLRMIKDIEAGKIDVVLVFKIDRLTRSTKDLIDLVELFNTHNCEFCSLVESIDTHTATGRMFLKIVGIFAEFERENLIERVRMGFERKASEGYTNNSNSISYGYTREIGQKIQQIDEKEAEIVQYIFREFTEELLNQVEIAKELNRKNIKTKTGKLWARSTIHSLLMNPTYIGIVRYCVEDSKRYREFEGKHEPIIDITQYEKAQELIKKQTKYTKTKKSGDRCYFNGALICGMCGSKLTTHHIQKTNKGGEIKDIIAYRCKNKLTKKDCTAKNISHLKMEQAFIEYIKTIEDLELSDNIIDNSTNANTTETIDKMTMELEKLHTKKQKVIKLYLDEKITFNDYKSMSEIIEQEESEILAVIGIQDETKDRHLETVLYREDVILSIKENWLLLTDREKKEFLQRFIESITVISEPQENTNQGKVKIKELNFYSM